MPKSRLIRTSSGRQTGPIEVKVDSLIQGISQQPPHLRLTGQAEEQINGWSSPVEGLCKRNPVRLIAKVLSTPAPEFFMEMMNVISDERYSVMVYPDGSNTNLFITLEGKPVSVDVHGTGLSVLPAARMDPLYLNASPMAAPAGAVIGDATSYIANGPEKFPNKYAFISTGPLGLLLNREKKVEMDPATSPVPDPQALVFVQGVAYDIEYKLTLNGTALPVVKTPAATDTNNLLSTSDIAAKLATEINKVAGFTATTDRYVVWVRRTDKANFTISLDDARGNTLGRIVKDSVVSTFEIPVVAPNNFVVKVAGDPSQTLDDKYLKFQTKGGGAFGDGGWVETIKPGIKFKLNQDTMPLIIYRAERGVLFVGPADGATRTQTVNGKTYSYTFPTWGTRTAGDEETNPNPEFVDKTIRDLTIFRGRHVVASGQSVIFSEANDIFNFFQDSSQALTAKDTFSVLATGEINTELNWLLPVGESVLAFSQYSQFQVRAADADVLTALTAIILRQSNIEMNPHLRPRLAGPQILFGTNVFNYSHFREYTFTDTPQRNLGLNLGSSNDVCALAPKYIEGLATNWAVGEAVDMAAASTPVDRKTLFIYKYLFSSASQGISKQQASWSKFRFSGDVRWVGFMDNEMHLVLSYPDGTYSARITNDELEVLGAEQVHLDRLLLYPECNLGPAKVLTDYDPSTDLTTFTLPYEIQGQARAVIRYVNGTKEGLLIGSATSGSQIVCERKGDFRNEKIAFGEEYEFMYEFTRFFVPSRDQARTRIVGKQSGRTQLLHMTTYHHNTGAYTVRIKRNNRERDTLHEFRARHPNVSNNRLDTEQSHLESGVFRVPIYSENKACRIMIESKSWLPVTITAANWEGAFSDRSREVG